MKRILILLILFSTYKGITQQIEWTPETALEYLNKPARHDHYGNYLDIPKGGGFTFTDEQPQMGSERCVLEFIDSHAGYDEDMTWDNLFAQAVILDLEMVDITSSDKTSYHRDHMKIQCFHYDGNQPSVFNWLITYEDGREVYNGHDQNNIHLDSMYIYSFHNYHLWSRDSLQSAFEYLVIGCKKVGHE